MTMHYLETIFKMLYYFVNLRIKPVVFFPSHHVPSSFRSRNHHANMGIINGFDTITRMSSFSVIQMRSLSRTADNRVRHMTLMHRECQKVHGDLLSIDQSLRHQEVEVVTFRDTMHTLNHCKVQRNYNRALCKKLGNKVLASKISRRKELFNLVATKWCRVLFLEYLDSAVFKHCRLQTEYYVQQNCGRFEDVQERVRLFLIFL